MNVVTAGVSIVLACLAMPAVSMAAGKAPKGPVPLQVRVDLPFQFCQPGPAGCAGRLVVRAIVRPHPDNLWLAFTLVSRTTEASYATSSMRQLLGTAPLLEQVVEWRFIPADDYIVKAVLGRTDETLVTQTIARIVGAM